MQRMASFDQKDRRGRLRLWCLVLGTLAAMVAVGIPWGLRVRAELSAPRNEATEDVPVAAVFLVDTSVSMNYRLENKTRLEQARTVIREHLGRFPAGSRAASAETSSRTRVAFFIGQSLSRLIPPS